MNKEDYLFYGLTREQIKSKLYTRINDALSKQYGKDVNVMIAQRVEAEWTAIKQRDAILDIGILYELVMWLQQKKYPYQMLYTAGSSFLFYLLGITSGNPLPPHSHCPKCHDIQWKLLYKDGFDISHTDSQNDAENRKCPCCQNDDTPLIYDGHDIPWQALWGYDESYLQFQLGLLKDHYEEVREWLQSHWLVIDRGLAVSDGWEDTWRQVSVANVRCAFLLEADGTGSSWAIARDKKTLQEWRALIADEVAEDTNLPIPHTFSDLLVIFGMIHGSGTLDESVMYMVETMGYSPSDMIVFRDDVYRYLRSYGWSEKNAWKGMERVRKGKGLQNITQEMKAAPDKWILDRCDRVLYLPAKAHIVEKLFLRLNIK